VRLVWFDDSGCGDPAVVGGKAAGLARIQECVAVPPWFCVTASAFYEAMDDVLQYFRPRWGQIRESGNSAIRDYSLEAEKMVVEVGLPAGLAEQVEGAGEIIGGMELAVRSSAICEDAACSCFAGIHLSHLNITPGDPLSDAIRSCWASLFSWRALTYRKALGLEAPFAMPVLVQRQIRAEYSGIVFTENPVDRSRDMLIEVVPGGGRELAGGQVRPSRYTVGRDGAVVEHECFIELESTLIERIAESSLGVEEIFGEPIDIEVVVDKDLMVHFVQARVLPGGSRQRTEDD